MNPSSAGARRTSRSPRPGTAAPRRPLRSTIGGRRDVREVPGQLKALPAQPDRWDEQLTGELYCDLYQALPVSERGAWLTSHGFLIYATKKAVTVIQGDVRGTAHLL